MEERKKNDFIKQLTSMTKEEIADFIKQNGKQAKPIPLVYFLE